jgi:hypothetical protein
MRGAGSSRAGDGARGRKDRVGQIHGPSPRSTTHSRACRRKDRVAELHAHPRRDLEPGVAARVGDGHRLLDRRVPSGLVLVVPRVDLDHELRQKRSWMAREPCNPTPASEAATKRMPDEVAPSHVVLAHQSVPPSSSG